MHANSGSDHALDPSIDNSPWSAAKIQKRFDVGRKWYHSASSVLYSTPSTGWHVGLSVDGPTLLLLFANGCLFSSD